MLLALAVREIFCLRSRPPCARLACEGVARLAGGRGGRAAQAGPGLQRRRLAPAAEAASERLGRVLRARSVGGWRAGAGGGAAQAGRRLGGGVRAAPTCPATADGRIPPSWRAWTGGDAAVLGVASGAMALLATGCFTLESR